MSHRDSFSDRRLNLGCRSKAAVLYRTVVQTSNKNCYGQQKSIGSSRVDGTLGPTGHLIVFVSISEGAHKIHESAARPATTATSIRGVEGVIEKRALLVEWV